jgi:hypothetical protein
MSKCVWITNIQWKMLFWKNLLKLEIWSQTTKESCRSNTLNKQKKWSPSPNQPTWKCKHNNKSSYKCNHDLIFKLKKKKKLKSISKVFLCVYVTTFLIYNGGHLDKFEMNLMNIKYIQKHFWYTIMNVFVVYYCLKIIWNYFKMTYSWK